jgi:hypothetical protein
MTYEQAVSLLSEAFTEPRADVSPADLKEELDAGAKIWCGERSAVLVRVRDCSTEERVCDIAPAAGDLIEILTDGWAAIQEFARVNACTQFQVRAGRDGWEPHLKKLGFERTAIVMRKLL